MQPIWNEDGLQDVPFTSFKSKRGHPEVKSRKFAGPGGVVAEQVVILWLNGTLNAMIEMEKIPAVLKCVVVVPVVGKTP